MGVYINGMEMPKYGCDHCFLRTGNYCGKIEKDESVVEYARKNERHPDCPLVPVPPHGRLRKRIVYRGEVFNAIEAARIIALDGILTDRYKDGFHDGLKRALEILANEVQDVPTIIPADPAEESE